MRICLSAIVILLGANLLIDLLDSDMMEVINERNETIQRQIDAMWGTKCHKLVGCLPIEEVSQGFGTDPQNRVSYRSGGDSTSPHLSNPSKCLSCVRSKPRWLLQFRTISVGHLPTRRSSLDGREPLTCISMVAELPRSVKIGCSCLTVGINQRQLSHAWMHYFPRSEWTESMFFKRIFSGL